MHVPKPFAATHAQSIDFIQSHPFASVTTSDPMQATHIPLSIIENSAEKLVLEGHVAKANSHHRCFDGREALCIFTGPHAYISGLDYEQGPAVPTWNYTSVHVTGNIKALLPDANLQSVERILSLYEQANLAREDIYDAGYIAKLSKAIVCFQIEVHDIQGVFKLGQHRSEADQTKTLRRLEASTSPEDLALAQFIKSLTI